MNKKLICSILTSSMLLTGVPAFAEGETVPEVRNNFILSEEEIVQPQPRVEEVKPEYFTLSVNGKVIALDKKLEFRGRCHSLVPVREFAEALGMEVAFDEATREVVVKKGEDEVRFVLGGTSLTSTLLEEGSMTLVEPVNVIDGRCYLQLCEIRPAFNLETVYSDDSGHHHINIAEN